VASTVARVAFLVDHPPVVPPPGNIAMRDCRGWWESVLVTVRDDRRGYITAEALADASHLSWARSRGRVCVTPRFLRGIARAEAYLARINRGAR
jgi:hypothetical protein